MATSHWMIEAVQEQGGLGNCRMGTQMASGAHAIIMDCHDGTVVKFEYIYSGSLSLLSNVEIPAYRELVGIPGITQRQELDFYGIDVPITWMRAYEKRTGQTVIDKELASKVRRKMYPVDKVTIIGLRLEHGGTPLSDMKMTEPELKDMMSQMTRTLAQVHERGYLHTDLSPDNILCQKGGTYKLTDFGLAARIGVTDNLEEPQGTFPYMSDSVERVSSGTYTPKDDMLGLAYVVWHIILPVPWRDLTLGSEASSQAKQSEAPTSWLQKYLLATDLYDGTNPEVLTGTI